MKNLPFCPTKWSKVSSKKKRNKGKKHRGHSKSPHSPCEGSLSEDNESSATRESGHSKTSASIPSLASSIEGRNADAASLAPGETGQATARSAQRGVDLEMPAAVQVSRQLSEETSSKDNSIEPTMDSPAAVSTSTELTPGVRCDTLLHIPPTSMPHLYASALAMNAMESILLDCVKLNYTLGRHGEQIKPVPVTKKISNIRTYAEAIAGWEYDEAVRAVKKENSILACQDIQARYNEMVYWNIIMKGARLLDQATLPTPRGRLDDFNMAEKVANKKFMIKAGYGTSYQNQRRCRIR